MSNSTKTAPFNKDHKQYVENYLVGRGEAEQWEVVLPKSNQLQLDYDQPFPFYPPHFHDVMGMLKERFPTHLVPEAVTARVYSSRSGNTHYVIDLPEGISDTERTAWQAVFGSDPKREAGHLLSLIRGDVNPMLLIMRKDR